MKKNILVSLLLLACAVSQAQIGFGVEYPNPSSVLELMSTTKGFLPPRMTSSQRTAISSPAVGLTIYNTETNCLEWWTGSDWYNTCVATIPGGVALVPGVAICDGSHPTTVVPITSPGTGKIWMDRNLGASGAATSSTDINAYGCLYQWGRGNDGHASVDWNKSKPVNLSVTTTYGIDTPGNNLFIISTNTTTYDWRDAQNNELWKGVNGINNPCPSGYRVPLFTELDAEFTNTKSPITNAGTAFSNLLFVLSGYRYYSDATLYYTGSNGYYWSSTVSGTYASLRYFSSGGTYSNAYIRANGFSVRCLKDWNI